MTQVESAILQQLQTAPALKWERLPVSSRDCFGIFAWQEVPGGLRRSVIAGALTGDNETRILFKVMEYRKKTSVGFTGQLTINSSYVALDPSKTSELTDRQKTQVKVGAVMVEEKIRQAVGQKSP
jgi:hypothetical protein